MHIEKTKLFASLILITGIFFFQFANSQDKATKLPFNENYQEPRSERNYLKLDFEIYSRMIIDHRRESVFQVGLTSPIDRGSIALIGEYENVDVFIGLKLEERGNINIHNLKFNRAFLKVNDLFNDFLDIQFFDIGYGAGNSFSIRPDMYANGAKFTLKPIPELNISFGYGIASDVFEIYPVSNSTVHTFLGTDRTTFTPNYHALTFDLRYENDFVPFGFYYGIALIDNGGSYFAKSYLPFNLNDQILHTSLGFDLNLLAYFQKDALRFDMAFTLPVGTLSRHISIGANGEFQNSPELNFLFRFYGDAEFGMGIGANYELMFALDSHTKQKVLGNRYDQYFKEAFKIAVVPRYTYGPVSTDLGVAYSIIGGKTARSSVDINRNIIFNKSKVYHNVNLETGVTWTPFPFSDLGKNFSVRGYYNFDFGDIQLDADHLHELGLQLKMSFNTLALD